MSIASKIVGLVAGASAVAVIGAAVAQGVPPDADVANHAIGAGQQSSHVTPMGETGVPEWENLPPVRAAVVEQPAPVAQTAPPAPAPVAAAPAEPAATMGAPAAEPAPAPEVVAEAPAPRADRN